MRSFVAAGAVTALLVLPPVLSFGAPLLQQTPDVDAAPRLRLVEEMRIGDAADPTAGFSQISSANGVDVDRDGQIYVYDVQDPRIRVYSPAGKLVRSMGRRGQGPGEFTGTPRIGVVGDTVWAIESSTNKITLFDRMGRLLSTATAAEITVAQYMSWGVVKALTMRSDGKITSNMGTFRYAAYYRNEASPPPGSTMTATDTGYYPRIVFDAKGVVIDTGGFDDNIPSNTPTIEYVQLANDARRSVPPPFPDYRLLVLWPEGRFRVDRKAPTAAAQTTFRVTRITYEGDTVYSRNYRYLPVRYSPVVQDTLAARSIGPYRVTDGPPPPPTATVAAAIRAKMNMPAFQTPVQSSFVGMDGALWLRREEDAAATYRWVLLDAKGNPRGRLDIPGNVRMAWSNGDTMWAVVPDKDDVPWLVKYRIASGPA